MSTELVQVTPPAHPSRRRGRGRELLVALGATLAAVALPLSLFMDKGDVPLVSILLSALGLASIPMARAKGFGWQVVARAVWWQSLAFGFILGGAIVFTGGFNKDLIVASPMLIAGAALALFGAGRVGLDHESAHFVPVAFRRSLTASLVMALADTIALLFYAGIVMTDHSPARMDTWLEAAPFIASAAVMGAAILGLFRLRLWALALNIVANIVIAGFAITGVFDIPDPIAVGLTVTAIAQLVLPLPLLGRIVKTRMG